MDINRLVNEEGVSGHTALLPTKNKALVDFDELDISDNAKKVLALVYKNLEEATSGPYIYKKTTVTLSYGGEVFTATGVQNQELGWKKNRPDETVEQPLPIEFQNVQKGDRVHIKGVTIEQHQTEPPERFTDGTLLQAMESAGKFSAEDDATCVGIGTAATRAPTIKNLVQKKLVVRVGEKGQPKYFVPTELGRFLYEKLPDKLKTADLTVDWEAKLSEVEKGTLEPNAFLEQIMDFTRKMLSDAADNTSLQQDKRNEF